MRTADQLRELAKSFRNEEKRRTDDALVALVAAEVQEYRQRLLDLQRPQLPPAPLDELLPLMGWLIYEATWETVQRIPTAWDREATSAEDRTKHEAAMAHIHALANAA